MVAIEPVSQADTERRRHPRVGRPAAKPLTAIQAAETSIAPSHPAWPARFRVEAEVLRVALAPLSPVIEHVGSTAVAGLAAMPVIDIAVGVSDPAAVDDFAARLANFGYLLMTGETHRAADRRVLMRQVRGVRTHHVHVVSAFGPAWHRLLMFRDMLRLDRDLAMAYESLKRELAQQTRGRPLLYACGKADFIASILGRPAFAAGHSSRTGPAAAGGDAARRRVRRPPAARTRCAPSSRAEYADAIKPT